MDEKDLDTTRAELAKLVDAQTAADVWTPAALAEKVHIVKLAISLLATGDPKVQSFVVEQIRRCKHERTAGHMALAVLGEVWDRQHGKAPPRSHAEVIRELEPLLATTPVASGTLVRAATRAVLSEGPQHALEKLTPFLTIEAVATHEGHVRFMNIASQMSSFEVSNPLVELVVKAVSRLDDAMAQNVLSSVLSNDPQFDEARAHLLELDVAPNVMFGILSYAVHKGGHAKIDAKRRQALLPLLQAAASRVREDPSARARLEVAEKALELPGSLLSPTPTKIPKAPKARATIALKDGAGTEGGPLLAVAKEALASWRGTLMANGKPAVEEFAGTDYGRACDVSENKSPFGPYGFIDVGAYRGLVLGRSFGHAKLKDGTCLLVMQGEGYDVAAILKEERSWKKLTGALDIPSGQLVVFDSAMEHAKTNNKATLKLAPGKYAVDEYDEDDSRSVWIVRLTPLATKA